MPQCTRNEYFRRIAECPDATCHCWDSEGEAITEFRSGGYIVARAVYRPDSVSYFR